jgi:hypothetical protein
LTVLGGCSVFTVGEAASGGTGTFTVPGACEAGLAGGALEIGLTGAVCGCGVATTLGALPG